MHIAGGYYANQRSLPTKRKHNVQHTALGCLAKCMITGLCLTVPRIWNHQQRITKEHGFCLSLRNVMLLHALSSVAFVPVKAIHQVKLDHGCILS